MITKIRGSEPHHDTTKAQTGVLFQKFKDLFNNQSEEIDLLRRVNLACKYTYQCLHV